MRYKYETNATGNGGIWGVIYPGGFVDPDFNKKVPYYLLDGDGTSWEYGIGYFDGSTDFRSSVVFDGTAGANTNITLSGSTPHTILFPEGGFRLEAPPTAEVYGDLLGSTGGFIDWTEEDHDSSVYSVNGLPGYTYVASGYPKTSSDVLDIIDYARWIRLHAYMRVQNTVSEATVYAGSLEVRGDGNYVDSWEEQQGVMIPANSNNGYCKLTTPPIRGEEYQNWFGESHPRLDNVRIYADGGGATCNFYVRLRIEYHF